MKNTRKPTIPEMVIGATTVASIALALHFSSVAEDYKQSHIELNAKYTDVLVENEELLSSNKELSGLLEQSRLEIERLNKETDTLQAEVDKQKGQIDAFTRQISELEKK